MLIAYKRPVQIVSPDIHWSTLEDVFEHMETNRLSEVYFSPKDDFFSGMNSDDFKIFSRELFDELMEMAHATHWHDSGAFDTITKKHNNTTYSIKIFESHPNCACVYDTLRTITICAN